MVLVEAGIDIVSTTGRAGVAVGCASIPSVESGTTGFEAGVLVSGGCMASPVSSSSGGAVGVSSSGAEDPGRLVPDSGRVEPTKVTDGWSALLDLIWIVRI